MNQLIVGNQIFVLSANGVKEFRSFLLLSLKILKYFFILSCSTFMRKIRPIKCRMHLV